MILYDDEGNLVTNPITLRAIKEAEQFIAEWEKRNDLERTNYKIF